MTETNNKDIASDYSISYIAEKPSTMEVHAPVTFLPDPRWTIATAAMQGMIANGYQWEADAIAKQAAKYADALIEELKR